MRSGISLIRQSDTVSRVYSRAFLFRKLDTSEVRDVLMKSIRSLSVPVDRIGNMQPKFATVCPSLYFIGYCHALSGVPSVTRNGVSTFYSNARPSDFHDQITMRSIMKAMQRRGYTRTVYLCKFDQWMSYFDLL